ncbi:hypothetical protein RSSM_00292 [Rhodopirellula sallentina SM41]|uniref:Uncharacterized protein n=1 Tax=Rhodopirellula sallentina SM41 TaxID=1263870 RepID=M5UQK9_9BACT|nr:hypothetical protein RSSM_00292 [Rhodopirellula sallentina SM41]
MDTRSRRTDRRPGISRIRSDRFYDRNVAIVRVLATLLLANNERG